jgi:hypothetical protein
VGAVVEGVLGGRGVESVSTLFLLYGSGVDVGVVGFQGRKYSEDKSADVYRPRRHSNHQPISSPLLHHRPHPRSRRRVIPI